MSGVEKKQYEVINKKPYVPAWVGWSCVGLYLVIFLATGFSLYKSLVCQFDSYLLVSISIGIVSIFVCLFCGSKYEWEVGRKLTRHESGFYHYIYYSPLPFVSSGKYDVEIREVSRILNKGKYITIYGVLNTSEAPLKPKPISSFKLRMDFKNNDEVLEDLSYLIKSTNRED